MEDLPLAYKLLFVTGIGFLLVWILRRNRASTNQPAIKPLSVNYHFTRKCNYACKFCFFTAKESYVLPLDEAKRGIEMLKESGMQKINFSGGEPFLHPKFLGELVKFCKELGIATSIISNGSKIRERWFREFGEHLDILGISCDSCNPETLEEIGRGTNGENHLDQLRRIKEWCAQYEVLFKINTTVVKSNVDEDLTDFITEMNPIRWKVFQCLLLKGENMGDGDLRDARSMTVTDEEFNRFVQRHRNVKCMVVESSTVMRDSYLILDPYMRFLNNETGERVPSPSILDVGVAEAQKGSGFNEQLFFQRGGKYKWTKKDRELDW